MNCNSFFLVILHLPFYAQGLLELSKLPFHVELVLMPKQNSDVAGDLLADVQHDCRIVSADCFR